MARHRFYVILAKKSYVRPVPLPRLLAATDRSELDMGRRHLSEAYDSERMRRTKVAVNEPTILIPWPTLGMQELASVCPSRLGNYNFNGTGGSPTSPRQI